MATNQSTDDFMLSSVYMDKEYTRKIVNFNKNIANRVTEMTK